MSNPLHPYRSDHEPTRPAAVRHTRRREIEQVGRLWTRHRLTILSGHPGVGKSALLHAGVVPSLEEVGGLLLPVGRVTHHVAFPMAALPPQNRFVFPLLASWAPGESPAQLSGSSIQQFLKRRLRYDRFGEPSRTHLCVDPAEVLFQEFPERETQRLRFLEDLFETLCGQPHLRLLLVLRTAMLDEARAFARRLEAEKVPTGLFSLGPLQADLFDRSDWCGPLAEELQTVRTPDGRKAHVPGIDPGLFSLLCARLGPELFQDPAALASKVDHVLGEHVEQTLSAVAVDHRLPLPDLEAWFRNAFIDPGPRTREKASFSPEVLRALEDKWLIRARIGPEDMDYELRHPRLREAVRSSSIRQVPIRRPDAAELLREAAATFWSGNLRLSRDQAKGAAQTCAPQDLEVTAQIECLLGDLTYSEGMFTEAAEHYKAAARTFEVLQNTDLVGHLLSALGRLSLRTDPAAALPELLAAATRLPHDLHVLTALGQALWQAGQAQTALTVLNEVLSEDGNNLEALRVRGELHADLGEAESALQDLDRIDRGASSSALSAWILANAMRARGKPRTAPSPESEELNEVVGAADRDNGPVLLRVARVRELSGDHPDAAKLAGRALRAKNPPIPPQLLLKAEKLKNRTST
ncbi:hypothetical protein GCM10010439_39780 [Actinocorallia aurantiaca]|uniref:Novel STAND NTPase 1 domain-containing protein n=1 Tax=Actinocorallia aurantiaca TaxID=46204 RepID=A0ABN3UBW1_9ACTN